MPMTEAKLLQIIDKYSSDELIEIYMKSANRPNSIVHVVGMLPRLRVLIIEGHREKAMRWLGFIQGVLFSNNIYSVEQLKEHNRPDEEVTNGS